MENECTDCEGGGVIYRRDKYGDLLDDMSCDPCKTCNGTGVIEIEPEPTELRDNAAAVLWSGRHTNQREVEELVKELLNTIDHLTVELTHAEQNSIDDHAKFRSFEVAIRRIGRIACGEDQVADDNSGGMRVIYTLTEKALSGGITRDEDIDSLEAELKAKDKRIEVLKELICTECGSDACSTKAGCPFEQALKGE